MIGFFGGVGVAAGCAIGLPLIAATGAAAGVTSISPSAQSAYIPHALAALTAAEIIGLGVLVSSQIGVTATLVGLAAISAPFIVPVVVALVAVGLVGLLLASVMDAANSPHPTR